MRIRILRTPRPSSIDGLRMDQFRPALCYDVGTTLAMLLLAEGWAEPVSSEAPALVIPLDDVPNLRMSVKQARQPEAAKASAADRPWSPRRSRKSSTAQT